MSTHYVPAFTVRGHDGTEQAACGQFVYPAEHSPEPTCENCLRWIDALASPPVYRSVEGVACCPACLRPATTILPEESLYLAAKRVLQYFDAKERGSYFPPNEDLHVARQLGQALEVVEEAARRDELVSRR